MNMTKYEKIKLLVSIPVFAILIILYALNINDYYINKFLFSVLTIEVIIDMIYNFKIKDMRKFEFFIDVCFLVFFIKQLIG